MLFLRRLGGPITAFLALLSLSIIAIVTFREGFKTMLVRRNVVKFEKRDGSTITFTIPWPAKQALDTPGQAKDLSSGINNIIGDIAEVASAILDGGNRVASAASKGAIGLQATPLQASSSILSAGASSILRDVNGQISQATSIVAGIIGDATSIVGSMLAEATNPSNVGVLSNTTTVSNSSSPTSRDPQEFLPQSALCKTCGSLNSHNITTAPSPTANTSASATFGHSTTASPTPCPTPITETCTITETWHSTHYAETATLYSFIANFTITCTETVSVCPPPNLYVSQPPTPTSPPLSILNNLIACANGVLAKREEDCTTAVNATTFPHYSMNISTPASYPATPTSFNPCPNAGYSCAECPNGWFCPPQQTPAQNCICGYGWACAHCKDGYFCIPSPIPGGNGSANSITTLIGNPSGPRSSFMLTSIAATPTLVPVGSSVPLIPGTITCVDDSVVVEGKDCLNGVLGPTGTPNTLDLNVINKALPAATTAITNPAGGLLTGVNSNASPLTGIPQPALALISKNPAGNFIPTIAGGINTAALSPVPMVPPLLEKAPILLESDSKDAAGPAAPVVGHLSTIIDGQSTVLPIIATIMHGSPTTVPILDTIINGQPTNLPVVNAPMVQLAKALGLAKRRRRMEEDGGGVKCDCVYEA